MDIVLLREFKNAFRAVKAAEVWVKDLKRQRDELHAEALRQFETGGVQSVNLDGCSIALRRDRFLKKLTKDDEAIMAALKATGHGALVKTTIGYHSGTLAALLREHEDEKRTLPAALKKVVGISEVFKLAVTGA